MRTFFPSIAEPNNIRYDVDRINYPSYDLQVIADCVTHFETMGDGDTQHAPHVQTHIDRFVDFCASAAQFLMEPVNSIQVDESQQHVSDYLASELHHYSVTYDRMIKALKIKYVDGKRRYYNITHLDLSSAKSKQYDTRWKDVEPWMDGSFKSVVTLLGCFQGTFLTAYAKLDDARSLYHDVSGHCAPGISAPDILGDVTGWDWHQDNEARGAFYALRHACGIRESYKSAERSLNGYLSNVRNRMESAHAEVG